MNQARKFKFKTHVDSRTDLSNKTLHGILYGKLLFKPFLYKSFGWYNAHSVQADALWGRSIKFQMKTHHKINTSLLMLREWTYTASSRDALGNTSPKKTIHKCPSNHVWKNIWGFINTSMWHLCLQKCKILAGNLQI